MNFIKRFIGRVYLKARNIGLVLEADQYKTSLAKCGSNVRIGANCKLIAKNISIGNNVSIGDNACIMSAISHVYIGNNVMLAPNVTIRGGNHRTDIVGKYMIDVTEPEKLPENDEDVIIEDDVWIGQHAIILKGVKIGEGSVIGAGSIVTKNVPPYTIHVGVHPTSEFRRFTEEEIKEHKEKLKLQQNDHG